MAHMAPPDPAAYPVYHWVPYQVQARVVVQVDLAGLADPPGSFAPALGRLTVDYSAAMVHRAAADSSYANSTEFCPGLPPVALGLHRGVCCNIIRKMLRLVEPLINSFKQPKVDKQAAKWRAALATLEQLDPGPDSRTVAVGALAVCLGFKAVGLSGSFLDNKIVVLADKEDLDAVADAAAIAERTGSAVTVSSLPAGSSNSSGVDGRIVRGFPSGLEAVVQTGLQTPDGSVVTAEDFIRSGMVSIYGANEQDPGIAALSLGTAEITNMAQFRPKLWKPVMDRILAATPAFN